MTGQATQRHSIMRPSEVRSRMRWQGARERLGPAAAPETIARLLAFLFLFGSTLLLLTLLLPGSVDRDAGGVGAAAGLGIVIGLLYLASYDRTPRPALLAGPAIGAAMIAAVVFFAGSQASAAYGTCLVWVVIASAMFFSPRVIAAHALFAVGLYAAAMVATPGATQLLGLKLTMAAGTTAIAGLVMGGLSSQLRQVLGRLADAARTDPLTGLLNRRAFDEGFDAELARCRRTRSAVALVMIDLDHFKAFNDRRGHLAGDAILQRLARVLNDTSRGVDLTARIGGEEFAVLAPETGVPGGLALAERLRRAMEIEFSSEKPTLTASLGVAGSPAHGGDRMQLLRAADAALYEAKQGGRNRAVVSSLEDVPPAPQRRLGDLPG